MSAARHDEERLGELLGALPPAPVGWVQAERELPRHVANSTRSSSGRVPTRHFGFG